MRKKPNFSNKERSLYEVVRNSSPIPTSPVKSFINASFGSHSTSSLPEVPKSRLTKVEPKYSIFKTQPKEQSNMLPAFKKLLEMRSHSVPFLEYKLKPVNVSYQSVLSDIEEASKSVVASKFQLNEIRTKISNCYKLRDRLRKNLKRF